MSDPEEKGKIVQMPVRVGYKSPPSTRDVRHEAMLMKFAEQAGGLEGERQQYTQIKRIIVGWENSGGEGNSSAG
jgi:hypothetical protein